jgi:hypothetical protein
MPCKVRAALLPRVPLALRLRPQCPPRAPPHATAACCALLTQPAFGARLQQLLGERMSAPDLEGLESKPRQARRQKVEDIKAQLL